MRSIAPIFLFVSISLLLDSIHPTAAGWSDDWPLVVEHIDTIAVMHADDGVTLIYFFDFVQGEWVVLDHRWPACDMAAGYDGKHFTLYWRDDGDSCWRLILAERWAETWERESPQAELHNRPWFARLLAPGLKQPAASPK